MEYITDERLEQMMDAAKVFAEAPCGVEINELSAKDIYAALMELKERRNGKSSVSDEFTVWLQDEEERYKNQESYLADSFNSGYHLAIRKAIEKVKELQREK